MPKFEKGDLVQYRHYVDLVIEDRGIQYLIQPMIRYYGTELVIIDVYDTESTLISTLFRGEL